MFLNIPVRFAKRDGSVKSYKKTISIYHSANRFFGEINIVASSYNTAEIAGNPNAAIRAGYVGIIIAKNITQMPTI